MLSLQKIGALFGQTFFAWLLVVLVLEDLGADRIFYLPIFGIFAFCSHFCNGRY